MKTVPLWNVGLSLIGFFALVQALVLFPYLATSGAVLVQYVQGRALVLVITILITILPFGLLILLGVLSVAHPTAVARFLWPGAAAEEQAPELRDEVAVLMFAAVGILVFAGALPELFRATLSMLVSSSTEASRLQPIAGGLARALLGVFLFFRPGAVLAFWRRRQLPAEEGGPT